MQRLLCYSTVTGGVGDQHYFIYWNAEASTLGVTDLGCRVFEVTLDRRERKKLLRNVAESLVENKWRNAFADKAFKLRRVDDESAEIVYVVEGVEIPRVDAEHCHARNVHLFKAALDEIQALSSQIRLDRSSATHINNNNKNNNNSSSCNLKRRSDGAERQPHAKPEQQSSPRKVPKLAVGRRKVGKVTGTVFSDNNDDE